MLCITGARPQKALGFDSAMHADSCASSKLVMVPEAGHAWITNCHTTVPNSVPPRRARNEITITLSCIAFLATPTPSAHSSAALLDACCAAVDELSEASTTFCGHLLHLCHTPSTGEGRPCSPHSATP